MINLYHKSLFVGISTSNTSSYSLFCDKDDGWGLDVRSGTIQRGGLNFFHKFKIQEGETLVVKLNKDEGELAFREENG